MLPDGNVFSCLIGEVSEAQHGQQRDDCAQQGQQQHLCQFHDKELLPAPSVNNILTVGPEIEFICSKGNNEQCGGEEEQGSCPGNGLPYIGKGEGAAQEHVLAIFVFWESIVQAVKEGIVDARDTYYDDGKQDPERTIVLYLHPFYFEQG